MPRRKPFSNKQKKQQLQQKREKKKLKNLDDPEKPQTKPLCAEQNDSEQDSHSSESPNEEEATVIKVHHQPTAKTGYDPNRYRLHFEAETQKELDQRKHDAKTKPLSKIAEEEMEISLEDIFKPGSILDIPKRPAWNYKMSKQAVEGQESRMFEAYLQEIYKHYKPEELSHFEHNLETWRQLWRVLEISEVILFITDIRHPVLHFSPALFSHVTVDLKKKLILILNKVDLVPPAVAVAWKNYFQSQFPDLYIICFTSFPKNTLEYQQTKVHTKLRRKGKRLLSAVGPKELLKVISDIYRGKVDFSSWQTKLETPPKETLDSLDSLSDEETDKEDSDNNNLQEDRSSVTTQSPTSVLTSDDVGEGVLTIGMIGHPNVGKSSLINGIVGKKVVSTSRTPGHTKHFQTIYLTPSVRLCDCPGLVFPSLVNKQIQILSGIYPIAQVREPYTAVGYLAERVPLIKLLQLNHPNSSDTIGAECEVWTAWDICDGNQDSWFYNALFIFV